jgi:hypothetical protein
MGWGIELDPQSGRAYYTHEASATTQWDLPPALFPLSEPTNDGELQTISQLNDGGGSSSRRA